MPEAEGTTCPHRTRQVPVAQQRILAHGDEEGPSRVAPAVELEDHRTLWDYRRLIELRGNWIFMARR